MAACDNLHGNSAEWQELFDFFMNNAPHHAFYMREKPEKGEEARICYIADIQGWLIKNCKLPWVQERLNENFDIQRMICGRAHHE